MSRPTSAGSSIKVCEKEESMGARRFLVPLQEGTGNNTFCIPNIEMSAEQFGEFWDNQRVRWEMFVARTGFWIFDQI